MVEQINEIKVPKRILNNLLASLSAGVVPRSGAPYIAIGRTEEINSLLERAPGWSSVGVARAGKPYGMQRCFERKRSTVE